MTRGPGWDPLHGHREAEAELLEAYRGGRLHHAWLLDGPEGIGKATLALRFATFLLAHPDSGSDAVAEAEHLGVDPGNPAARQVANRAHPNLFRLERPRNDKNQPTGTVIAVEQVRRLGQFLAGTPGAAGWRVVIVDPVDELNRNSANALLKMLEEPPARTVFLLVAHHAGRLLPTIRSRCRRLRMHALADEELRRALAELGLDEEGDAGLALSLAHGSVGEAQRLMAEEEDGTLGALVELLEALPRAPAEKVLAFADRAGRRDREATFSLARGVILDFIASRVRLLAGEGAAPARLACWSEVWEKVERGFSQAETLNLDRTQTLLGVFQALSEAARQEERRSAPQSA